MPRLVHRSSCEFSSCSHRSCRLPQGVARHFVEIRRRRVDAAVFDDDELHVGTAVPTPAVDALAQDIDVVERRNDDGNGRVTHDRRAYACRFNVTGRCTPPGRVRAARCNPRRLHREAAPRQPDPAESSGAPGVITMSQKPARSSAIRSDRGEKWLTCTRLSARVGRYPAEQSPAPLLLPQLPWPGGHLDRRPSARSKQPRNAREYTDGVGNMLEHIRHRDCVESRRVLIDFVHVQLPDGRTCPPCGIRRGPRIELEPLCGPALLAGERNESSGVGADVQESPSRRVQPPCQRLQNPAEDDVLVVRLELRFDPFVGPALVVEPIEEPRQCRTRRGLGESAPGAAQKIERLARVRCQLRVLRGVGRELEYELVHSGQFRPAAHVTRRPRLERGNWGRDHAVTACSISAPMSVHERLRRRSARGRMRSAAERAFDRQ